jgi:glycosyltransferase involved in cell wall biosynthesis
MISDVYFPRVNGVSTSIRTFREGLAELGCTTALVAPAYPAASSDDAEALRAPSRYLPFDPEDRVMSTRAARKACRRFAGAVDVLHIQTPFVAQRVGVAMARELGVPVVATYHTYFEEYLYHYVPFLPRRFWRGVARSFSRRQCNVLDAVVAPSPQMERVLRDYGVTTPREVIPTGIVPDDFRGGDGAAFRERHGIPAERPVMLLVGRVAHEKNIGFLLRVLADVRRAVPDALLVVAGEGPALPWLKREVAAAGLAANVLLVGYLDRRGALLDCYRAANVFVFASRTETQGLVLLEALASSTPVVSTAVLGSADVLANARGALVVPEERAAFAAAVTRVLTEPGLRASLAAAAREHVVVHWSSAAMTRRMLALYERVARRSAVVTQRQSVEQT